MRLGSVLYSLVYFSSTVIALEPLPPREFMEARCGMFASTAGLNPTIINQHYEKAFKKMTKEQILFQGGWAEGYLYGISKSKTYDNSLKISAHSTYLAICENLDTTYK